MKENITMRITEGELKDLLTDYYGKKYNDNDFDIIFETKEECVGFYETKMIQTHIKLKRKIRIGNNAVTIEEELDEDDIKEIICEELRDIDYEINNLRFENRIKYEGFYGDEVPTFDGVNIDLKRKQKQYRI